MKLENDRNNVTSACFVLFRRVANENKREKIHSRCNDRKLVSRRWNKTDFRFYVCAYICISARLGWSNDILAFSSASFIYHVVSKFLQQSIHPKFLTLRCLPRWSINRTKQCLFILATILVRMMKLIFCCNVIDCRLILSFLINRAETFDAKNI